MIIDLSLKNQFLYAGCDVEEVAGRLNLTTPVANAVSIVGRNIAHIMDTAPSCERVVLTGPMAVWAYLIVFHSVVHLVREVVYDDGRNPPVVVARHG